MLVWATPFRLNSYAFGSFSLLGGLWFPSPIVPPRQRSRGGSGDLRYPTPSLPGSLRQGHLLPISGLAKWGDLRSPLTRGKGWESFPERAQWLLILMACLALRSQLPRRLLMEKRAWPERLWLLVPVGPHPLLTPGGVGTALQQTLCTHAAEGDPSTCHHIHRPRSCPLRVPRIQTQICRFQRKSGSIRNPPPMVRAALLCVAVSIATVPGCCAGCCTNAARASAVQSASQQ